MIGLLPSFCVRLVVVAFLFLGSTAVLAQRTIRRPLKARTVEVVDSTVRLDSVAFPGKLVVVSGYEKPLRSTREALHVTNNDSTRLLKAVTLDISYFDVNGTQIHRRVVDLDCDIPSGETKMISFRSWDVQNRFFYAAGPKPRSHAYPFTVRLEVKLACYFLGQGTGS